MSLAAVAAALVAVYAVPAAAQWAWRDESGRTVYSDRPPPASIKSDQILRQPGPQGYGGSVVQNAAPASDGKGDAKDAPKGPKTLAEREQDFRKRQQENAENEKKQADEQARNDQRAAECERMRGYLKALEDGQRVARTDAQGNREFLDDAGRAKEVSRIRDGLSRNCEGS
jgi:hypothetical protein